MERIRQDIALDSSLPWTEKLATVYPQTITADVNDDLARELELYVLVTCLWTAPLTSLLLLPSLYRVHYRFITALHHQL